MTEPLDGNALAGALAESFGREMTAERGACRHCGTIAPIAELVVFALAPGAVVRCRACGRVVFVLVTIGGQIRPYMDDFQLVGGEETG